MIISSRSITPNSKPALLSPRQDYTTINNGTFIKEFKDKHFLVWRGNFSDNRADRHLGYSRASFERSFSEETRDLAIIISYPTGVNGIIVLLETRPQKYRNWNKKSNKLIKRPQITRSFRRFGEHHCNCSYITIAKPMKTLEQHYPAKHN